MTYPVGEFLLNDPFLNQITFSVFDVVEFDYFKPIEFYGFSHLHDFYKDEFATINIYH